MPDVPINYGTPFHFIVYFGYFHTLLLTIILCLECCIFAKISQIVCLVNVHILIFQIVKCVCRLWKDFTYYHMFETL